MLGLWLSDLSHKSLQAPCEINLVAKVKAALLENLLNHFDVRLLARLVLAARCRLGDTGLPSQGDVEERFDAQDGTTQNLANYGC